MSTTPRARPTDGNHTRGVHPTPHARDPFERFAAWTTHVSGGRWAFILAFGTIIAWALTGPIFRFSEMWQLVINTGTTIVTFLMVFLIQNAQNRESKAIHLKLDELIYAVKRASNEMIEIEGLSEAELDAIAERYHRIAERSHSKIHAALAGVADDVEEVEGRLKGVERRVEEVEGRVGRPPDG